MYFASTKYGDQPPLVDINPPTKVVSLGRAFLCSEPYFLKKVSSSITSVQIAMINIDVSYSVIDSLLHS